jgi:hypothetical protein
MQLHNFMLGSRLFIKANEGQLTARLPYNLMAMMKALNVALMFFFSTFSLQKFSSMGFWCKMCRPFELPQGTTLYEWRILGNRLRFAVLSPCVFYAVGIKDTWAQYGFMEHFGFSMRDRP